MVHPSVERMIEILEKEEAKDAEQEAMADSMVEDAAQRAFFTTRHGERSATFSHAVECIRSVHPKRDPFTELEEMSASVTTTLFRKSSHVLVKVYFILGKNGWEPSKIYLPTRKHFQKGERLEVVKRASAVLPTIMRK